MTKNTRKSSLEAAVIKQFHGIIAATRFRDRAIAKAVGLPAAQLRLLALVQREPGISLSAGASGLGLEISTVSNLVNDLAQSRLVRAIPDASNRRRKLLFPQPRSARYITKDGAELTVGLLTLLVREVPATALHQLNIGLAALSERIPTELCSKLRQRARVAPCVAKHLAATNARRRRPALGS